jgi:hypothetical protein
VLPVRYTIVMLLAALLCELTYSMRWTAALLLIIVNPNNLADTIFVHTFLRYVEIVLLLRESFVEEVRKYLCLPVYLIIFIFLHLCQSLADRLLNPHIFERFH